MSLWLYSFWSPFAPLPRAKHQCIHALFPFSFSLQIMTSVSSMCGKKSGPLASERDTDTRQVLCTGAILRSCKYGNFLCVRVSHIPNDRFTLLTTSFKHSKPCCHMLDFVLNNWDKPVALNDIILNIFIMLIL